MSERSRPPRTLAEWATLAVGILVVGSLVAVALVEQVRLVGTDGPAVAVEFAIDQVEIRADGYYVPYTVLNTGETGISAAEIWIDVFDGERLLESDEIRVEFLPLRGTQEGVYVSQYDPNVYAFRERVESLLLP